MTEKTELKQVLGPPVDYSHHALTKGLLVLCTIFCCPLQVVFLIHGCSYCVQVLPTIEKISVDAKYLGMCCPTFCFFLSVCCNYISLLRYSLGPNCSKSE